MKIRSEIAKLADRLVSEERDEWAKLLAHQKKINDARNKVVDQNTKPISQ